MLNGWTQPSGRVEDAVHTGVDRDPRRRVHGGIRGGTPAPAPAGQAEESQATPSPRDEQCDARGELREGHRECLSPWARVVEL